MSPEMKATIEADMNAAVAMELGALIGYLASYTVKFDDEIRRGEVTREQVRAYADWQLSELRD